MTELERWRLLASDARLVLGTRPTVVAHMVTSEAKTLPGWIHREHILAMADALEAAADRIDELETELRDAKQVIAVLDP